MSSPYVTLGNKSLEQWKVTELREELKKRKLTTKGLKEDLLKRLDEAVRSEWAAASPIEDNDATQSELSIEQTKTDPVSTGEDKDPIDISTDVGEKLDGKPEHEFECHRDTLSDVNITMEADSTVTGETVEPVTGETVEASAVTGETVEPVTASGEESKGEYSTVMVTSDELQPSQEDAKLELSDPCNQLPKSMDEAPPTEPDIQGSETQNEGMQQMENDDPKCPQPDSSPQPLKYQVSEVNPELGSQVTSDSVCNESVPIIEKNELKVDVITDNVKLELDVKHEMGQTSAGGGAASDGGKSDPAADEESLGKNDIDEPLDQKDFKQIYDKVVSLEAVGGSNVENVDNLKNIDSLDLGPPEKLSLDRSSGDDSMEEDISDGKQMEYKSDANKTSDNVEKSGKPLANEDDHVDVVGHDKPVEMKAVDTENDTVSAQGFAKRKFPDKEAVGHNDTAKKARRWNTEGSKVSEHQSGGVATSVTPRGLSEPSFKRTVTDPASNEETPKERIVPPSSKPPTNSLRIDRFLRPFTNKAVNELLSRTGTVTSFWMDNIKTHCYVSYSSVEEAVETRNAVYNLQWPPNGGRLLAAEFVDPQEVKTRLEAPPMSPATPSTGAAANFSTAKTHPTMPPQPSPRQQIPRQQLPPPPLPPPQLNNPPLTKGRLHPSREPLQREPLQARDRLNLPPPPPLPEKIDPPIVTLDDLFRKTKATPRIYYLPLSDVQVAEKLKSQGKSVNQ